MSCKACGQSLTRFEYQSRSADEAQTIAYKCSRCPLDIDKFFRDPPLPHLYLLRGPRKRQERTPVVAVQNVHHSRMLRVTSKSKSIFGDTKFSSASCFNVLDNSGKLYKVYLDGPWKGKAISKISSDRIGPNVTLEGLQSANVDCDKGKTYIDFEYALVDDFAILRRNDEVSMVSLITDPTDDDILSLIESCYIMGMCPESLSDYCSNVFLGSVSNLNARAYDAFEVEDSEYFFSSKPDGERMWLVKYGSVWVYCRRLLNFKIESFRIDSKIHILVNSNPCPVLDIEVMMGFDDILIDLLVDENGTLSPYDRNILWVNEHVSRMSCHYGPIKDIHIRQFFETVQGASEYCKTLRYPIDGIAAVSRSSTDMRKIKGVKSIELKLDEDRRLLSKEGTPLMRLGDDHTFDAGSILEIRFTADNGAISVKECFQRFDKVSANDNASISHVLDSCFKPSQDQTVRNSIWRWSNELRHHIYRYTESRDKDRPIILDIGSGSGQSTDSFAEATDCSFILVEPDELKCKALSRRLGIRGYDKNPRSVIPHISRLRRNVGKYHILNCSLDDLLNDAPTMTNIKDSIRCAVACFSCQFVIKSIDALMGFKIPFIGCYYSYEGISPGESIIDYGNISMTRVSKTEARVKWGNDRAYTEPPVEDDDIPMNVSAIGGMDMVPFSDGTEGHPAYDACNHVRVLISSYL